MIRSLNNLSDTAKGIIAVTVGTIFMLYTFDILGRWVNGVFILGDVGLILYGLMKLDVISYWHKFMGKKKH